jgi:hypothetical protein
MSLAVLLLLQAATTQPQSGHDVLARMHDRWQGKWFRTFTFVQRTTFPDRPAQTWYETIENPGRLRIDFGPIDSMNTAIINNDSVYPFKHGQPAGPSSGSTPHWTRGCSRRANGSVRAGSGNDEAREPDHDCSSLSQARNATS